MKPVEGRAAVPGGELHYRLAGTGALGPLLVFENGWSGSFPYTRWLEEALAPHARLLFYDRAGVADSLGTAPPTTAGLTQQLQALLAGLGLAQPVVVMGHSYGGLIAALHAAQAPGLVKAIVQVDPTPEFDDATVDASLGMVPLLARLLQAFALLGMDGPLLAQLARELPAEAVARLRRPRLSALRSLNGSLAELRLLPEIRQAVAASVSARGCPRLVISAAPLHKAPSRLQQWLGSDRKERALLEAAHRLHRRHAAQNDASQWTSLPYGHVSLISDRRAAAEIAAAILRFLG